MNIGIIGRRGEGKSTLAEHVALHIQREAGAHTIVIFDPKRTFKNVAHTNNLEVFDDLIEKPGLGIVSYQPYSGSTVQGETVAEEFTMFCEALGIEKHLGDDAPSRPDLGPVVMVVDEAWLLQSGSQIHPWLEKLVRLADLKEFFLIQLAHRPGDFSPKVRAQLDELFIFRQFLPSDVSVIEEMAGSEIAGLVEELPSHHVIDFHVSSGKFENWNEPKNWYIDIEKNPVGATTNGTTGRNAGRPDSDVRRPDAGTAGNNERAEESHVGSGQSR